MVEVTSKWVGFDEVRRRLESLPDKIQKKAMTSALRAAAKPMLKTAKAKAAKSSGALADSLAIKATKRRLGGAVTTVWIMPVKKNAKALAKYMAHYGIIPNSKNVKQGMPHAHLVEFGHSTRGGGTVAAQPYLRPAFASHAAGLGRGFNKALGKSIDRIIKKMNKTSKAKYK